MKTVTRLLRALFAWCCALLLLLWRLTCRYRVVNDPRPRLRDRKQPYAYALLHAHQVAAVFCNDERTLVAMVSRSADGDLLVPSLRVRRVDAARGSSRKGNRDKGGRAALAELTRRAKAGTPVLLAVDGPQGPRGHVHRGIVSLAVEARAQILPTVVVCSRHWTLSRTWDRFQIPKPFATVQLIFGEPLNAPRAPTTAEQDALRLRVATELAALEKQNDPREWPRVRQSWAQAIPSQRPDA